MSTKEVPDYGTTLIKDTTNDLSVVILFEELLILILGLVLGAIITYYVILPKLVKSALDSSRASIKGQVAEQIVPFLPEFKYNPSDAHFLGKPIDYVVFDGLAKNDLQRIVFLDIKCGKKANLNPKQNKIKDLVQNKKVTWDTIHIEDNNTKTKKNGAETQ